MDIKEKFLIEKMHSTICSGNFHELDVLTLLILLRPHVEKKSHIMEFSDFVAHRERDRGLLQEFLKCFQCVLCGNSNNLNVKSVVTNKQIRDSFNEVFRKINLPEFSDELANQVTACIISLLQSVKITLPNSQTSNLAVGISSKHIELRGSGTVPAGHVVDLPILIAQNCLADASSYPSSCMRPEYVIEAYSKNGRLNLEQRSYRV